VTTARRSAVPGLLALVLLAVVSCSEPAPESPTEPAKPARIDILGTQTKTYSQFDEDLIIRDFFQDRRDGFYVDVGCAWAQRASTTYYLDKHLGWSGIGVDALPDYAPMWARKRPRSKFYNFLVSDHSFSEDSFYRTKWLSLSSAVEDMAEKHKGGYVEIKVPTITIDKLLEMNGVEKIDFLSMDIEGFQLTALAGFDIEKYAPELVCIEAYRPDRPKIKAWFEERGYRRIDRYLERDTINWYFAPADLGE
jgi:FkbM family methyltransferase